MTPGKLDQRVTFQTKTRPPDGMGGATETWVSAATVSAHVRPMRGNETTQGERVVAEGQYRFVVRFRSDVTEAMRIVWNGENYNIRNVRREGSRKMYLDIDAGRGIG